MKHSATDKEFCVYCHTNKINNKRYVGITCRDPMRRWGVNGTGYRQNIHFYNAIQKYGWENFKHEILYQGLTLEEATFIEVRLIAEYKSNIPDFGYNSTTGGETNQEYSDETRAKMSVAAKNRIVTEEWRRHISESCKGKTPWNLGRELSAEPKEKLRQASLNRTHSQESINKMRENAWKKRAVEIDGIKFDSIRLCSLYLGISGWKLAAWLRGENSFPEEYKNRGLAYYQEPHKYVAVFSDSQSKGVVCEDVYFVSMSACDRYYNLPRMTITRWLMGTEKMPQEFKDKGLKYSDKKRYRYIAEGR